MRKSRFTPPPEQNLRGKFKKRLFAGILCMTLAVAAPTAAASTDPASVDSASTAPEPVTIFDSDSKSLQIDNVIAIQDYAGAPAVLFEFTYTNKTSMANTPLTDYFVTVFQNGISLTSTSVFDTNYAALCTNAFTQVKDGASISYAVVYKLNDLTASLDVEISDSIVNGNVQKFSIPMNNSGTNAGTEGAAETNSGTEATDWEAKYKELEEKYNDLLAKYEELAGTSSGTISNAPAEIKSGSYDIGNNHFTFSDSVRDDVTGKWRLSEVSTQDGAETYAVEYYKTLFSSDDEIHFIINFALNTTSQITVLMPGTLDVTVKEYVDGEEHSAKELGGGNVLGEYEINIETGEINEL